MSSRPRTVALATVIGLAACGSLTDQNSATTGGVPATEPTSPPVSRETVATSVTYAAGDKNPASREFTRFVLIRDDTRLLDSEAVFSATGQRWFARYLAEAYGFASEVTVRQVVATSADLVKTVHEIDPSARPDTFSGTAVMIQPNEKYGEASVWWLSEEYLVQLSVEAPDKDLESWWSSVQPISGLDWAAVKANTLQPILGAPSVAEINLEGYAISVRAPDPSVGTYICVSPPDGPADCSMLSGAGPLGPNFGSFIFGQDWIVALYDPALESNSIPAQVSLDDTTLSLAEGKGGRFALVRLGAERMTVRLASNRIDGESSQVLFDVALDRPW